MSTNPRPFGLLAEFDTPAAILHAAERMREAGYRRWDVHTPSPVQGMDAAMGLRTARITWWAFWGGVIGFGLGQLMIWYMNAHQYPLRVGGKPLFSPYFALPPSFELTLLCAAFGVTLGWLWRCRLPRWHHPLLKHPRFKAATLDKFFLVVEESDPKYEEAELRALLEQAGGAHIERVEA